MIADETFARIVRETHTGLRFYIRALGVKSASVDDIAQDTYLVAYKRRTDLDSQENAIFWLRVIAKNLVMNELTKNSRRQRLLDENLTTLLIQSEDSLPDHTTLTDREGIRANLHQCLSKLTERVRQIVDARYFQDKNASQIGSEFNLSPAAVRKSLFHARKALATCLRTGNIHPIKL